MNRERATGRPAMTTVSGPAISGLGPHGERAASPDHLSLSEAEIVAVRLRRPRVAVLLHTTTSDWARLELNGISSTLVRHGATVCEVVDCGFRIDAQIAALRRLAADPPEAVISLPIASTAVAEAHRGVSRAGSKLVLLDNGPTGLLPGDDYVSVVSADNFGLGIIAARLLSPHVPQGGKVGILSYQADFFATNEREIAFRTWVGSERPDIRLQPIRFSAVDAVAAPLMRFLDAHPDAAGLFAVWDVPAAAAVSVLRARACRMPMTTIDLGKDVAVALAQGDLVKGVAGQRAFDQGVAAAMATLSALAGRRPPSWLVLPGMDVTAANVGDAFRGIWHEPPPQELSSAP